MSDSRKTGISGITDKMVVIRHATDTDLVRVAEYLAKYGKDGDLQNAEVVVADEDRRIIGFGILKKENDAGCVSIFEDSRRKGIGSAIVNHLMTYEPLKKVYATRNASYFTRYGYARATLKSNSRKRKSGAACRMPLMERLPIAFYEKR